MLTYTTAHSIQDHRQILALQRANLPENLVDGRNNPEGFVSLKHSYEILKGMNYPHPHIVAKEAEKVVAYALVMQPYWKEEIPLLLPMFERIETFEYKGQLLGTTSYFIMGQICVAASHRGEGVFRGLYQKMKSELDHHFQYCITEVSSKNSRSLNAHHAIGFETIFSYRTEDGLHNWEVVLWDWS